MKAVRIHQHGGADVLRYEDAPEPLLEQDRVLVQVQACALNHLDLWMRAGVPGWTIPFPHVLGSDISGVVAEADVLAVGVKPGDRVLLCPGISCGHCEYCYKGLDSACRQYTLFGIMAQGGYAEYVCSPRANVFPIPGDLTFEEAAAVPLVFLTAWHMLATRVNLRPGEDVLVIGAGSGVGSAAIQVARLLGAARIIAVAGSEEKREKTRALGATDTVNHTCQSIAAEVRRITGKRGVDVVFDHVGEAVWADCFNSLATYGRFVTCGVTSGGNVPLDLQSLFGRQRAIFGSFMGGKGELSEVLKHIAAGRLKPVIDSAFPLKDAAMAQRKMESRNFFGKIVLHIPE